MKKVIKPENCIATVTICDENRYKHTARNVPRKLLHNYCTCTYKQITGLLLTTFCLILSFTSFGQNQSKHWYQNGKEIDFTQTPPQVVNLPASISDPQGAANGVYGPDGHCLFYVVDNTLFDKNANPIPIGYSSLPSWGEVSIFPVPGSCSKYFIIQMSNFYHDLFFRKTLYYSEYDLSLNNGNGGITPGKEAIEIGNFVSDIPPYYIDPLGGIAVTKLRSDNTRFLYLAQHNEEKGVLLRYKITEDGITDQTQLYEGNYDFSNCEVDISPDGTKLAFACLKYAFSNGNPDNDVTIVHLDANGDLNTSMGTNGITNFNIPGDVNQPYTGVEFSPDNTTLYVGARGMGIYTIDLVNGAISPNPIPNTAPFGNSQLELAYNAGTPYILAASSSTVIGAINCSTNVFNEHYIMGAATIFHNASYNLPYMGFYTLPDQIDGENYDTWFDNYTPDCCANTLYYHVDVKNTDQTATWDGAANPYGVSTIRISSELKVNAGTLTIKNMTLQFKDGAKLTVAQGAKLILDHSTLTALDCGNTWVGVQVLGTASSSQYGNNQGWVVLKNNSLIEHARCGIYTGNGNDLSTAGGIIRAENSSFLNNGKDIGFISYHNVSGNNTEYNNRSNFTKCNFTIDDNFRFFQADCRASMWDVKGILFSGCNFINNNSILDYSPNLAGIIAYDAGFIVNAYCSQQQYPQPCLSSNLTPSAFEHFKYGIRATRINKPYSFYVDQSLFKYNIQSILSEGVNNIAILRNKFEVGGNQESWFNSGLFINTGTGYRVEDNTFTGIGSSPVYTLGTYIYNVGQSNNEVYHNTYSGLYAANISEGDNRNSQFDAEGHQYLCNEQSNDVFDIMVHTGQGIRGYQGAPLSPAQNTFSQNGTAQSDYYNHSNQTIVQYYNSNPNPATQAIDFTPDWFIQIPTNSSNDCASHLTKYDGSGLLTETHKLELIEGFSERESDYLNAHYLYFSLLDQGNTPALIDNIEYNWSQDAWDLRNNLLARSPNLSTEALLRAAGTGTLPDALLMEVLLANIGACKDKDFLYALANEIPNPLPQYMIDILISAPRPESLLRSAAEQMAFYGGDMSLNANLIMGNVLTDTTFVNSDLDNWLTRTHSAEDQYALAETLLSEGDPIQAQQMLDQILIMFPNIAKHPDEHNWYQHLFD